MNKAASGQSFSIGLSLPFTEVSALQELRDIPECFELLELSGELVSQAKQLHNDNELLHEFDFFNFRDLLPASLTGQLTTAGTSIVNEYKKKILIYIIKHLLYLHRYISVKPNIKQLNLLI